MKKVICPGEALIDFVSTDVGKSLENTNGFVKKAGGAPANVASAISTILKANNINTSLLFKLENHSTTLAFVSLMEDGERDFEFARDADSLLSIDMFKDKLECFDLFHFGSATAFLEGELKKTYYKLKEYAVENNKLITFDANYRENLFADKKEEFIKCSVDFIKDSFIVKLSEEEALLISGKNEVKEAAQYIVKLGCENLIITLGKKGSLVTTKKTQVLVPTKEMVMIDATGAGDAFMGAVIAQIINKPDKDIVEIVKLANLVGGITTTKIGALESIPTWEEVEKYK